MRRKHTTDELQGKTFHSLTLKKHSLKSASDGRTRHYWLCDCECGKSVERREDYICQGKAQSCGCKHPRNYKGWAKTQWKGYGELNGQYLSTIKERSKRLSLECDLDIQWLWALFESQSRKCALTGLPLRFATPSERRKGIEQTASLDRIDSTKGYIKTNVQWVHKDVNRMKNEYPLDRYIEICKLVAANAPATPALAA